MAIQGKELEFKQARRDKHMSLTDLAKVLEVDKSAVSYWERGLRYPRKEYHKKIENYLGKPISELMKEKE